MVTRVDDIPSVHDDGNQTFDENVRIKQALTQIPRCAPDDHARHLVLLTVLRAWAHFACEHNLQYWIAYGTLVGYVQRRGLLPHDPDIDVLMMARDTPKLVAIATLLYSNLTLLNSSMYKLKVHPQWYIVQYSNRSYFHSQGIHFVAPNARFVHRERACHVDIYPTYDYHPDQSNSSTNTSTILSEYDRNYYWKPYPRKWTFPLRSCEFSGIRLLCPAQPEKLVAAFYGQTALFQSDKSCIK
ncbi:unnamed protein product, partial [Didymodactylos carnosus]